MNFLILMTDQQNGTTILPDSRYKAITPNVDRIRERGVTFRRCFTPSPHCCPSRATWMTGLYPTQHGVYNNVEVTNSLGRELNPGVRMWSEDMRQAGFEMEYSGKWHISVKESPAERGFNTRYIDHCRGGEWDFGQEEYVRRGWQTYRALPKWDDAPRGKGEVLRPGYKRYTHFGIGVKGNDEATIEDALNVIRNRPKDAGPWCQVVSVNGPHDPYFVPQEYLDLYADRDIALPDNFDDPMSDRPGFYRRTKDVFSQLSRQEHIESIRHYLAYCTYMDALFGKVLDAAEAAGQLDDTVIIYLSDHGDYLGEHGLWCKGIPCFRPAYHVPLVVADPRHPETASSTVDAFASLSDFAPTILELAGIQANRRFTGQSLAAFVRGEEPADWRDALFMQTNGNELYGIQRSIMTDKWKFVFNGFDYDELYDLENDPGETHNLAGEPGSQEIIFELSKRLWTFAAQVDDNCLSQYIMVGLAQYGPGIIFQDMPIHRGPIPVG